MKTKFSAALLPLLLMGACTSSEPDLISFNETPEIDNPNFVSVEEALRSADEHFAAVFGPRTRAERKVRDVETFRSPNQTRSADDDEVFGFYIVNYDNDGGFAMLSADRRREAVYAISDEGSLHLADTIRNKGLSWYINDYAATQGVITPPTPPIDTITPNPGGGMPIGSIEILSKAHLSGFMSRFHQESPYNKYCLTNEGKRAAVGCAPLAVGTIVGFYEFPQKILGYTFYWTTMKNDSTHNGWPRLFEVLGTPSLLNASYGEDATGTAPSMIKPALRSLGYTAVKSSSFDTDIIERSLAKGNPVLCSGSTIEGAKRIGHIWVIDGAYISSIITPTFDPSNPDVRTSRYYHCVWGWGGTGNGYFYYNDDNRIGGTSKNPLGGNQENQAEAPKFFNLDIIYDFTH